MSQKGITITVAIILVLLLGAWVATKSNVVKAPTTSTEVQMSSSPSNFQPVSQTSVQIQNYQFSPSTITVKAGDTVTWTNQDSVEHSATSDDGSFDTGLMSQGKSGSVTFSKPGTYTYHCKIHPTMHGTVIVQ